MNSQNHQHLQIESQSGWLWKLGGQGLLSNWKRRYFQVKGDMLYYYADDTCKDIYGQLLLSGNEIVKHSLDIRNPDRKYKFEIIPGRDKEGPVTSSHGTLLLATSTNEDMQNWIKLFDKVIYSPFGGGMFGRTVQETVESEKKKSGGFIPIIVDKCIYYIKEKGLNEEGIFRLPGKAEEVEELKNKFNKGENPELSERLDVHAVASLLKQYFRELPEPLIPYDFFCLFMAASQKYDENEAEGLQLYSAHLNKIPKCNYNLLKFLCRFLYEVQENSEENKMTASNLGTVFGPNLLNPKTDNHHIIMENNSTVVKVVSNFILQHSILFPESPDEQCYKQSHIYSVVENLIEFDEYENGAETLPPLSSGKQNHISNTFQRTNSMPDNIERPKASKANGSTPPERPKRPNLEARKIRQQAEELEDLQEKCKAYQNKIQELHMELLEERKVKDALMITLQDERRKRVALEERVEHLEGGIGDFLEKYGIDLKHPNKILDNGI